MRNRPHPIIHPGKTTHYLSLIRSYLQQMGEMVGGTVGTGSMRQERDRPAVLETIESLSETTTIRESHADSPRSAIICASAAAEQIDNFCAPYPFVHWRPTMCDMPWTNRSCVRLKMCIAQWAKAIDSVCVNCVRCAAGSGQNKAQESQYIHLLLGVTRPHIRERDTHYKH